MKKKLLLAITFGLVLTGLFMGCGNEKSAVKEEQKVIKVGTNATYVPFEFRDKNEKLTGFDIEVVDAIAQELGVKIEHVNISFDGLIPALGTDHIDMIASGMTITEKRKERIDFSFPYYKSGLGAIVSKESNIKSLADLEGKTIAIQMGTTGEAEAEKIKNATLRRFDNNSEAILELKIGGADAVVADLPVAQYYLSTEGSELAILIPFATEKPEYFGFGFKKGSALKEEINSAIKVLKNNGKLDEIYQKYFNENAPEMPES